MADAVERSGTAVRWSCPDNVVLEVERGEIIQALSSLVRNAVEAHEELPAGAPRTLEIAAEAVDGVVAIRVSDSGAGVAADIAGRIFEPSFTTRAAGTGLGLAIARRLVRGHGGELVLADPGAGRGATFLVTLPCTVEARPEWEG
jgi:signal transduction histidine kinase